MSQFPRIVLVDLTLTWGQHANGTPATKFVRKGTVVDVVPGGQLEAAFGVQNLSGVIPPNDWRRSEYSADAFSKAALANLGGCRAVFYVASASAG